ncbi:SDR family oxidoreductase [bacterium]|nr:MAG: SDR family oxidoreductase [bacterium]
MKTVVITGAGKGIGLELAKTFASFGFRVFALSRNIEQLKILSLTNPTIYPVNCDLTDKNAVSHFVATLDNSLVDVLINNAGVLINKSFWEQSDQDWEIQIQTNLLAPVRLIRALKNHLSDYAHIVNISSMGGFQGSVKFPGLSAYSSTKGALAILSECLDVEFQKQNIHVNALCLGAVQTEMLDQAFPGYKAPVQAIDMAEFIYQFAVNSGQFMSGKIVPVSKSNPNNG